MQIINIHEAKTNLSKLIAAVVGGQEVVIARAGKPVARLEPYKKTLKPRIAGLWKGKVRMAKDFSEEDKAINKLFYGK